MCFLIWSQSSVATLSPLLLLSPWRVTGIWPWLLFPLWGLFFCDLSCMVLNIIIHCLSIYICILGLSHLSFTGYPVCVSSWCCVKLNSCSKSLQPHTPTEFPFQYLAAEFSLLGNPPLHELAPVLLQVCLPPAFTLAALPLASAYSYRNDFVPRLISDPRVLSYCISVKNLKS